MCPNTFFPSTISSLIKYNVKCELAIDCFNCKTGVFPQIIHFNVNKRKQLQSTFFAKKVKSSMGNI